jgi:hypothetical protein
VSAALTPLNHWPRAKAALALDLHFVTSERQPPKLWSLPKHYLDLLGSGGPHATLEPRLYCDDRQVKMLFVSAQHGWDPITPGQPWLGFTARTRADALADMDLARELSQDSGAPALGWQDDPAADDLDVTSEELRTAEWLEGRGDEQSMHAAALIRHRVRSAQAGELPQGQRRVVDHGLPWKRSTPPGWRASATRVRTPTPGIPASRDLVPLLPEEAQVTFAPGLRSNAGRRPTECRGRQGDMQLRAPTTTEPA